MVAYTAPSSSASVKDSSTNRRAFLSNLAKSAIGASSAVITTSSGNPNRAMAAEDININEDVYFGAGCFWHVQHEFIQAERNILGRKDNELTSLTGYAGGLKTGDKGAVCYHNFQSIGDYGRLGHGEVVGMSIPPSAIPQFSTEYFSLFDEKGERADPMDKGGEYRYVLYFCC